MIIATLKKVYAYIFKGKKKMKTVISFQTTNMQVYNETITESTGEMALSWVDGNGLASSQSLAIPQNKSFVLAYHPTNRNFFAFESMDQLTDEYQIHKLVRIVA